jgi:hypothetical protein
MNKYGPDSDAMNLGCLVSIIIVFISVAVALGIRIIKWGMN